MLRINIVLLYYQIVPLFSSITNERIRPYTHREFETDIESLPCVSAWDFGAECARVVERLLSSEVSAIMERAYNQQYKGLGTFINECSKIIQIFQERKTADLHFYGRKNESLEPAAKIQVYVEEGKCEYFPWVLSILRLKLLKIVIITSLLTQFNGFFDFITGLNVEIYHGYDPNMLERASDDVLNAVLSKRMEHLRTVKLCNVLIRKDYLVRLASSEFRSLHLCNCNVIESADKSLNDTQIVFNESYKSISIEDCVFPENLGQQIVSKLHDVLLINLNSCTRLANLCLNSLKYDILYDKSTALHNLKRLSFFDFCTTEFLSIPTRPKYLTITIMDEMQTEKQFMEALKNTELKHLILVNVSGYHVLDVSNILCFGLNTLETLEIRASNSCAIETDRKIEFQDVQLPSLRSLRISCGTVDHQTLRIVCSLRQVTNFFMNVNHKCLKSFVSIFTSSYYFSNSLTKLVIKTGYITKAEINAIIEYFTGLEELCLCIGRAIWTYDVDNRSVSQVTANSCEQSVNASESKTAPSDIKILRYEGTSSRELLSILSTDHFINLLWNLTQLEIALKTYISPFECGAKLNRQSSESDFHFLKQLVQFMSNKYKRLTVLIVIHNKIDEENLFWRRKLFRIRFGIVKMWYERSDENNKERVVWECHK